ncbi:MAG: hypothetical protein RIB84_23180 [Sneathiellaceae bacterium]
MRRTTEIPPSYSLKIAESPDGIENCFLLTISGELQPAVYMQVLDGIRHQIRNDELNVIHDLRSASVYLPPALLTEIYRHIFRTGIRTLRFVTIDPDLARSQVTKFAATIARLEGLATGAEHVTRFEEGHDAMRRLLAQSREALLAASPETSGHLRAGPGDDHYVYPSFSVRVVEAPWGVAGTVLVETSGQYGLDELAQSYREWLAGHEGEVLNVFADERKARSWPTDDSITRFYGTFVACGIRRMSVVMIDEDPLRPTRMAQSRDLARQTGLDIEMEIVTTVEDAVERMRALLARPAAPGSG